ncbi:hypothetical protein C1645_820860 [Glomus cerebriforme]|uniref:Uncharacterized protein n=1 Tax=Glomus cerebriforme TaxID=658196 RepID=A0A397T3E2_9GLOM|nr:hypothetical protein C1645_820860 [Glomus cerebriforme]
MEQDNKLHLICLLILALTGSSYIGYSVLLFNKAGYFEISDYFIKNFGFNRCKSLIISNIVVYFFGAITIICFFIANVGRFNIVKKFKAKVIGSFKILKRFNNNSFIKILRWIHIITLIVYPAIISGYLISTNSTITKVAFGICSISFTRLVEHFGDGPEKINTAISFYLNFDNANNKEQIKNMKKLKKVIEEQTTKKNI